jgi:hypothetical protein
VTFRAPKLLLLGFALALTFVPKALPKFQLNNPSPPQAEAAAELRVLALVAFLSRNGFEALGEQRKFGRLVQASSGNCRLRLVEMDPNGSTRDLVRLITTQHDRAAVIFDGMIYADQPMVRTALSHSWTRLLNRIGVATPQKLVLGVAASDGCSLEKLPWNEMADDRGTGNLPIRELSSHVMS